MEENKNPEMTPSKIHNRQAAWQIWLPFTFGLLIFVGLAVLAGYAVFGEWNAGENWTAFSVMLWITPACLGGLLGLALAVGCVIILTKALTNLPGAAGRLITGINKIQAQVENISSRVAQPVISSGSQKGGWDRFWELIRSKK